MIHLISLLKKRLVIYPPIFFTPYHQDGRRQAGINVTTLIVPSDGGFREIEVLSRCIQAERMSPHVFDAFLNTSSIHLGFYSSVFVRHVLRRFTPS
jgi:hypothetical protein